MLFDITRTSQQEINKLQCLMEIVSGAPGGFLSKLRKIIDKGFTLK